MIELEEARDADGAQLQGRALSTLRRLLLRDYDDYWTLGQEDIDLAKARLWRPGLEW